MVQIFKFFFVALTIWLSLVCFCRNEVDALIDEFVIKTKRLMVAASKEIDKWRR